jgi:oligopeptide transport system permease protein
MIRLILGGIVGIISGYFGGRVDNILMRIADVFYAIPDILFAIIMSAAFRDTWFGQQMGGLLLLFSSLALFGWEGLARLVRGQVLSLKEKEFVEAARALGATPTRIMWRHIVPNTLAPVIVSLAFGIPSAIIGEAGLSFIGLGVRPPTASWGNMLQDGLSSIYSQPTLIAAPATCIAVILLSFTFLGDGLRDALDPRMKQ